MGFHAISLVLLLLIAVEVTRTQGEGSWLNFAREVALIYLCSLRCLFQMVQSHLLFFCPWCLWRIWSSQLSFCAKEAFFCYIRALPSVAMKALLFSRVSVNSRHLQRFFIWWSKTRWPHRNLTVFEAIVKLDLCEFFALKRTGVCLYLYW